MQAADGDEELSNSVDVSMVSMATEEELNTTDDEQADEQASAASDTFNAPSLYPGAVVIGWFYGRSTARGQSVDGGPCTGEEMRQLARKGEINASTLLWTSTAERTVGEGGKVTDVSFPDGDAKDASVVLSDLYERADHVDSMFQVGLDGRGLRQTEWLKQQGGGDDSAGAGGQRGGQQAAVKGDNGEEKRERGETDDDDDDDEGRRLSCAGAIRKKHPCLSAICCCVWIACAPICCCVAGKMPPV